MRHKAWLAVLFCVLLAPATGWADIYTYIDASGKVFYTNVAPDARYRARIYRLTKSGGRARIKPGNPADFEQHVRAAARTYSMDPHLIKAVIKIESDFDHQAVSSKGAKGLMQLMPETAQDMNVSDPFDPRANIMGGTCYLKRLLGRFNGNLPLTLAAYNAGPGAVERCGGIPNYGETQRYVQAVLHHYNRMKAAALPATPWAVTAAN